MRVTLGRMLVAIVAITAACGGSETGVDAEAGSVTPPPLVTLPETLSPLPLGRASRPPAPNPAELTIQYIHRLPELDFVQNSPNPTVDGWPAVGQSVTWRAFVKNWFLRDVDVGYRWSIGTAEVGSGRMRIRAGEVGTADYVAPWSFDRKQLTFTIDPANEVDEEEEENNQLTIDTNALSIGLYVEQSFYDAFRANQYKLVGAHSTSFEDWAQRQIYFYNELFRRAVYPETPDGVTDRVRLDRITIAPDGTLPNANVPNTTDRTVDLKYGLLASQASGRQYASTEVDMNNQAYYSGVLQHELGHARSMIDVYGFDVYDGLPGHAVDVRVNGQPLVGSAWMQAESVLFNNFPGLWVRVAEDGLMGRRWTYMDRYSAAMWNRMTGQRAIAGNVNAPTNLGWFMNALLPSQTRLVVADLDWKRIPNARVQIYRAKPVIGTVEVAYGRRFEATPDVEITTDAAGEVSLGHDPFISGSSTAVSHDGAFSNAVLLIGVEKNGRRAFEFLTVTQLNYAYIAGHRDLAVIPMRFDLR